MSYSLTMTKENDYLPFVIILNLLFIIGLIKIFLKLYEKYNVEFTVKLTIIVGFSLRLVWAIFVPILPVSDFKGYHGAALAMANNTSVLTKNYGFVFLISLGYRLFPNYVTAKIINVIFSTLSIYLIFFNFT